MSTPASFEQATTRLDEIVGTIGRNDVSLDVALTLFEEGIGLLRTASQALSGTEAKLATLMEDAAGALTVVPLPGTDA